jgi:hypothetical protein
MNLLRPVRAITFLLLILSVASFAQQRGPHILVVDPKFDYGFVPDSARVSHTFWVNNLGTDSLKIFQVKVTCGCTQATVSQGVIAVNDSMPIEILFDSANRLHKQTRTTTIVCNDPTNSKCEVTFQCFVHDPGETFGPASIIKNRRLRLTTADQGKTIPVTVKNISREPLSVKLIDYPSELVTVEVPAEPVPAGGKADILVSVRKDLVKQNFLKSFTVEMSDADKSRYTIPIRMAEPISALGAPVKKN